MKSRLMLLSTLALLTVWVAACNLPQPTSAAGSQAGATETVQSAQETLSAAATGTALVLITQTVQNAETTVATAPATTLTPDSTQPTGTTPLQVTTGRIQEESQSPAAVIDIEYPIFSDTGGNPVTGINQEVEALIARHTDEFRKMLSTPVPTPDYETGPNGLTIRYEVRHNAKGLVSIYFPVSLYNQGAAHPLPFSETLTYDLRQDRHLELGDLFQPGTDFLGRVSQLSIEDLKRQDALMWDQGAQPLPENYKSWNVTSEGLVITFDPYQVTPYAMGFQKVVLPWGSLADMLNPDLGESINFIGFAG